MKRSSGIIAYKIENDILKVLLCHFGGPYKRNLDIGGWTLSKGEKEENEKIIETAIREFKEETNLDVKTEINYLKTKKVSRRKLLIMFYTNSDFDITNCKSNTFEIEYPKGSNKRETFSEMDKYEWMDINTAKKKIIKNQLFFLERLEKELKYKGEI